MRRPSALSNADLRMELATYGVHVERIIKSHRPGFEDQLARLRKSGPTEPVERNPDAARVKCDLEDIVKEMKKHKLTLRDHQTEALEKFWEWHEQGRGGILGDEMGLGKTCMTIVHLMRLRKLGYGPFFVMCPLSVVDHWIKEIERFSCDLLQPLFLDSPMLLRGAFKAKYPTFAKNMVVIVSHAHLMRLKSTKSRGGNFHFTGSKFDMVVIDEAQKCKSTTSILHDRAMRLTSRFLLLTGTPIQNTLNELYALLAILDRERFPLKNEEQWVEEHTGKPDEVKALLAPYFLRRTKELVCKDLPPVNQIIFYHGLNELQTKLYLDVLHCDHDSLSSQQYNSLIGKQMQLRKVIGHPWLLNGLEPEPFEEGEHMVEASEKLTVIDRLLKYLLAKGHSVLLFSQFVIFLDIVEDYLNLRGIEYARIDGRIGLEERNVAVDAFNSSKHGEKGPRVFLLSTRAGGLGLNLTNADTVVFCDSDWNPQVDLQAMARCHRIGQTKPVRVIRLTARYTVEQYLQAKARLKLQLTDTILGEEEGSLLGVALAEQMARGAESLDRRRGKASVDLTDAAIERVVGGTDSAGRWIAMTEEEEARKNEENEKEDEEEEEERDALLPIHNIDVADHTDVKVEDYLNFMGRDYRVNAHDRDEMELELRFKGFNGTRRNGSRETNEALHDREVRLQRLIEMQQKRMEKTARRRSREEKEEEVLGAKRVKLHADHDDVQPIDAIPPVE